MKAEYPSDPVTANGTTWWKDIPGYLGKYQASMDGQIRRVYKSGKVRILSQYRRNNSKRQKEILRRRLFVKLTSHTGKSKDEPVFNLVVRTFFPQRNDDIVAYHINQDVTDNHVRNIGFTDRKTLGQMTARMANRRKSVFKVNRDGEVIAVYGSIREAAEKNFMSYQSVIDRCKGKVKKPFSLDGYNYIYER